MSTDEVRVTRSYREGDEEEINRLFNQVFDADRPLSDWIWKFKANPSQDTRFIGLAEVNGSIVGHYAGVPRLLQYKDRILKVSFIADNFVVPEYRGGVRGVQWDVFRRVCDCHVLYDYACGLGFPNREHYVIGKRFLKYSDFAKVAVLNKRLNWRLSFETRFPWIPRPVASSVAALSSSLNRVAVWRRGRGTGRSLVRRIEGFDERFDAFWNRVRGQRAIIGVRDRRYLSWRYARPGHDYEILVSETDGHMTGYLVLTVVQDGRARIGRIVDMLVDERVETGSNLVRHALLRFLSKGVDQVKCWMLDHTEAYKALLYHGFVAREQDQMVTGVYMIFNRTVDADVIGNSRNWYVTMGDSDAF